MTELDQPEETEEQRLEREAKVRDWRARSALRSAPDLAQYVRAIAVGGKIETGETLREWTAPMRISASDAVDEMFSQLVDWRGRWQRWTPTTEPTAQPGVWRSGDQEVIGFAAGTTPQLAQILVRHQTSWLLEHADSITRQAGAGDYQENVTGIIWALRSKFPTRGHRDREVSPRPCPICGERAVGADWFVEGDPASVRVECAMCGHRIPVKRMRNNATDEWLPTVEVVTDPLIVSEERRLLLAKPLILPSEAAYLVGRTKRTVNRWITDGLATYAHWDGNRRVKLSEVRDWIETTR